MSVDPVTAISTGGASFNRYWYAANNPYKFTDPDGREPDHLEKPNEKVCDAACQDARRRIMEERMLQHIKAAAAIGIIKRQSNSTLRSKWEAKYNQKWPKDPNNPNRNQDIAHRKAVGDGGDPNDPENYRPQPHDEHMQEHRENGDFKRWGARARSGSATSEPVTTPSPEVVPEVVMPEVPLFEIVVP